MKGLKFLFAAVLFTGFIGFSNNVKAQAVVVKDAGYGLSAGGETVSATSSVAVSTPSGNRVMVIEWQLSPGNPLIPEKGVRKITIGGAGMTDTQALVFPNGKVKGVFHDNGAGTVTPNPGND